MVTQASSVIFHLHQARGHTTPLAEMMATRVGAQLSKTLAVRTHTSCISSVSGECVTAIASGGEQEHGEENHGPRSTHHRRDRQWTP